MDKGGNTVRIIVLGATGSIGTQTLDVIEHLNGLHARGACARRFEVVGLAAGRRAEPLADLAARVGDPKLAVADENAGRDCAFRGPDAAERLVRSVECDLVVAAMVGVAGLPAALAAVELGRDVALANKETLVAAGQLVMDAARGSGSRLLPVDSEHSGVWQCLCGASGRNAPPDMPVEHVRRVTLTASGGPFRTLSAAELSGVTPEQALRHPTWRMGPKNTIDSATLMNKVLELIEAHWLFGLGPERLDVLVHPQSIVHALVEFEDGSLLAQLASTDMRGPIQTALTYPDRAPGCAPALDLAMLSRLEFERPDEVRFPALALARRAMQSSQGLVLNAANEVAVRAFLEGRLAFDRIAAVVRETMDDIASQAVSTLGEVLDLDQRARHVARERAASRAR